MARSSINAGSVSVIENPETQGSITTARSVGPRVGVGIDPDLVDGRSGGRRDRGEAVSTIGNLTLTEGGKPRIEGSLEEYSPRKYFDERTLGILRGFAGRLEDEGEVRHYNQVLTGLAEALVVDDVTKAAYEAAEAEITSRGSDEIAESVLSFYRDQFRKSFQVIDGYVEDRPLDSLTESERTARKGQERALLLYSEFLLANTQINSVHDERREVGREFLDNRLAPALATLNTSDEQRYALGRAFSALQNYAEFSFTQACNNIIDHRIEYLPAGDPSASSRGGVALDADFVNNIHFSRANTRIEDARRLVISALDGLNEPARQRWVEQRGQNPEVDLTRTAVPFSDWQEQIEAQIAEGEHLDQSRPMESKDYINGILGTRKEETGFLGTKRAHKLNHHIKNVEHKAPIKRPGASKDRLEIAQATEIAIMAGVWQGEWNQGATAKEGESHPKEFYERVVDITVWSVTLNSADAVANFIDQLEAADAMQMNGEVVGAVLGNQIEVPNAQAFRVPVLNNHGQPSFLVVDRETYGKMLTTARNSQESYANLARQDSRYAVHDRETRHAAFRPQLRENRMTPEGWVDQERDFMLAEEVSRQRATSLELGTEVDRFVAGQLNEAMERYRAQFNEFQMNFCRESRYRELAAGRLMLRGVAGNAPDFNRLMAQEMNAVALEYINRWNTFRAMTARALDLQQLTTNGDLDSESLAVAERDLLTFLANIDCEYEIQVCVGSTNHSVGELTLAFEPFMRTLEPPSFRGRLIREAYSEARDSYNAVSPRAGQRHLERVPDTINTLLDENGTLVKLNSGATLENPVTTIAPDPREFMPGTALKERLAVMEAERIVPALRELTQGERSFIDTYRRNMQFLTETDDMEYPANDAARVDLATRRDITERLLGRTLTDAEINRFLDNNALVVEERVDAIHRLQIAASYSRGLVGVTSILSNFASGRDASRLGEFPTEDLITYAVIANASVRALSSIDLTQMQDAPPPVPDRSSKVENPLMISGEHPDDPIMKKISIEYENALNDFTSSLTLGTRLRTQFNGVTI